VGMIPPVTDKIIAPLLVPTRVGMIPYSKQPEQ